MRSIFGDTVLHVALTVMEDAACGPVHRRIAQAGMLVGGYVQAGILSYARAFAALEAHLPRVTDHFQRGLKELEQGLQEGQVRALPLDALDQTIHEWLRFWAAAPPPQPRRPLRHLRRRRHQTPQHRSQP